MDSQGSITLLIEKIGCGDERAAQELFNRYFTQLLCVAKKKLAGAACGVEDEEDAVLSALDSFFGRAKKQQFPQLKDRHNLWPLLIKITERKVINQRKRQAAQKRGGGKVINDVLLLQAGLAEVRAPEPTPETLAEVADQCRWLISILDRDLPKVARMKLEGFTNAEIADSLQVVERSVERKLKAIRDVWSEELNRVVDDDNTMR